MNFTICPMKITNHNFKNYGNLISIKNKKFKNINNGYAKNFYARIPSPVVYINLKLN